MDGKILTIRCCGKAHDDGRGNILFAVRGNKLFCKCQDANCRNWVELTFDIPGVTLELDKAGITQKIVPRGTFFSMKPAITLVETESHG